MRKTILTFIAAAVAVSGVVAPAMAQKKGGILKGYHRGNPPSGSPHEEATISTVMQYMGVFNNLVMFDPKKRIESAETLVPDLATSWKWDASKTKLSFQLRFGYQMARRQTVYGQGRQVHVRPSSGQVEKKAAKEPAIDLVSQSERGNGQR